MAARRQRRNLRRRNLLLALVMLSAGAARCAAEQSCGMDNTSAVVSILRAVRAALRPGGAGSLPQQAGGAGPPPKLSHAAHYQVARMLQENHCAEYHPLTFAHAHTVTVPGWGYNVTILRSDDIVSSQMSQGMGWEPREVFLMLKAMNASLPDWAPETAKRARPVLVDVGANLGAFTLAAAAVQYEVLAFEASRENRQMLRQSLCSNPELMPRVTLYPYGLGASERTCYMVAQADNLGNQVGVCGVGSEAEALRRAAEGMPEPAQAAAHRGGGSEHRVMGSMQVVRLDDVLHREVKVMKVDVEGQEAAVLQGAQRLLGRPNVWFIMVEFNLVRLRQNLPDNATKVTQFVHDLHGLGYDVSTMAFDGPYLDISKVDDELVTSRKPDFLCNLFFVRRRRPPGGDAGGGGARTPL